MKLTVRILKKYYREEETGKVTGKFFVQQANGKDSWKTVKEFESTQLETAQRYAKNISKPLPKDEVIKNWK